MNTQLADKVTIEAIQKIALKKKYKLFINDTKDFNLNIWNIRSKDLKSNTFNDVSVIFWRYNGLWHIEKYGITTDPGVFYLHNLLNSAGTAIIKPGQYLNSWSLGLHKGKYKALVQTLPITVIRDFDGDEYLDTGNNLADMIASAEYKKKQYKDPNLGNMYEIYDSKGDLKYRESTGLYGINFHNSGKTFVGKLINSWSAGCQVFDSWEEYWNKFIPLMEHAETVWGNKFTITILNEEEFD